MKIHYKTQDYVWKGDYWGVNPIKSFRVVTSGSETVEVERFGNIWENTSHTPEQLLELGYLILAGDGKPKIKDYTESRLKYRQPMQNEFYREKMQVEDLTIAVQWLLSHYPDMSALSDKEVFEEMKRREAYVSE